MTTIKPFNELTVDEFVELPPPHKTEYPYSIEAVQIEYLGRYIDNGTNLHQIAIAGHRYSFRTDLLKYSFYDFRDMDTDNKQVARTAKGFREKMRIISGSPVAGRLIAELSRSFPFCTNN